ncbi:hypothetical protein [Mycolicibacterium peregrinum]|uniref:hypothetical protein n=1 Tax=Mycolicibacterium peregrinum TaxID=43304 RepID=UPI003AB01320
MEDRELISARTSLTVAEVEDLLAAQLGGQWTTPGIRGRVLSTTEGRVSVVPDVVTRGGVGVLPKAANSVSQRAFAERVFEALAQRLPGRIELLDATDTPIKVRPARPGAAA